jgi:hypothetical protein
MRSRPPSRKLVANHLFALTIRSCKYVVETRIGYTVLIWGRNCMQDLDVHWRVITTSISGNLVIV